jgi:hypothetical protein
MQRILLEVPNGPRAWRRENLALPIKSIELNRGANLLWGLKGQHPFQERDFHSGTTTGRPTSDVERRNFDWAPRRKAHSGRTMYGSFFGRMLTNCVWPTNPIAWTDDYDVLSTPRGPTHLVGSVGLGSNRSTTIMRPLPQYGQRWRSTGSSAASSECILGRGVDVD